MFSYAFSNSLMSDAPFPFSLPSFPFRPNSDLKSDVRTCFRLHFSDPMIAFPSFYIKAGQDPPRDPGHLCNINALFHVVKSEIPYVEAPGDE